MRYTIQSLLLLPALMIISSCGNSGSKPGGPAGAAPQIKEYKVLALQPRSATLNTDYPASIQGQQNIEIRPRVDGYVEKIFVDEGSIVRKGQPLFKINAPQFEQEVRTATASIKAAEADVSAANMAVNKVKPLVEKDIVSKYELESAQYTYQAKLAALAQAKAALSNAKTNLGYTMVTSPVDGVVGAIPFRLGSLVSGNNAEPLTTVSSTGNVYAYFAFNEKLLLDFFKDDKGLTLAQKLAKLPEVSLILSDGTLYDQKGRIQTITGQINTTTGSANVRASFPNPKGLIRSGSSATVRIPDAIKDAILVPQSATFELQDKRFAVVVDKDGKTKSTPITVMKNTAGTFFVVKDGLKAGDRIVLEGVATLKDDTQIKVAPTSEEVVYADLK
ncbi:efflux RND transporter periplasmic adaptor subunit [Pedobacter gandavensis]|uniref:Efflux RND transporter periplasmic adaptor subunit n=1 Tax=Pedobacter gandavensis TaxID=2679963 RepID=A0ABR6F049_9SPHI|nr:efflux RND transporter periplasmic adaptor subunit [Pedobacter gandavensis]MBB2150905.1 efflux RND transporter periplasmic adaptor subunit [Pedobacter gandavensis]